MFVLNGGVESSSEYQIERSLRLRKSATGHLTRTNGVYGSLQRLTFSAWVKRGALVDCMLLNAGLSVAADDQIRFNASHQLQVNLNNGTTTYTFTSTAVFRDVSAWYHIVVSIDTTKSANADKVRVWVNNALRSMTVSGSLPIGYTFTGFNTPKTHYIGKWYNGAGYEFDGYIAEVYFIDGEALTPTAFGEFDKYGYWSALPYEPLVYSGFTQFPDSVVGGDPYYNNVTVLVHSNGTNGQTTFTDSSSSPKTLTRIGTTQISTAQSKFGGSSLFNGAVNAGNSLNVANSLANILVFSGDFTVECWFYQTADTEFNFSGLITQLNTNSRSSSSISSFELGVFTYTPSLNVFHTATAQYQIAGTVKIEYNVWNHVAVTRSGNLLKMFVNGTQSGTTQTLSGAMVSNTSQPMIGGSNQSGTTRHSFKGYIDDVRITNGVARYTSNFLVNKSNSFYLPFTNTASVSTTLGNDFSGNNNNWTPTNVSLSYNSRYFVPSTTAFPNSAPSDPNFSNVSLLLHGDGANGGAVFTDSSSANRTITRVGTPTTSTTQVKFGTASLLFNGVDANVLTVAHNIALSPESGDFTVEAWIYKTSSVGLQYICGKHDPFTIGTTEYTIGITSAGVLTCSFGRNDVGQQQTVYSSTGAIKLNTWTHVAFTKTGLNGYVFVNGYLEGTATAVSNTPVQNQRLTIGGWDRGSYIGYVFVGHIDEFRFTKGVDRYSGLTPHVFSAPSYDLMYDVPLGGGGSVGNGLGNYATLNSTNMVLRTVSDPIISDGNLSVKSGSSNSSTGGFVGTQEMRSGKWYHEAHITNIHQFNNVDIGIIGSNSNSTLFANQNSCYAAFSNGLSSNAIVKNGVVLQTSITTVSVGDIISCAVDLDNGTCKFYLNNAQFGTTVTGLTLGISYVFWGYGGTSSLGMVPDMSCNFGQYPFAYTLPAGYKALHTGNLPAPVIPQPNLYFDTVTYNGGGTYLMPTAAFPDSVGAGDPNFASVTTLMHFEGSGFGDSSSSPNIFTNSGATISTAQKKFGTQSALFNGTSSRITTPYSTDYVFGSGDFTVECWIYPLAYTNPASAVISFWSNTQGWAWELGLSGSNPYASFNGNIYVYAPVVSLNAWHHLCVSRRGPTIALYVDGVFGNSIDFGTTAIIATGAALTIGCVSAPNTWYFNGYIDEVRITKGVARYDISRQVINPANLQPDLVWIKGRGTTANHQLIDSARGVTKSINSNTSNVESTDVTLLSSFNANGFNLGSSTLTNQGGYAFSAWEWKKGVTPGFDIVTYTGNGVYRNISHNLGAFPNFVIIKRRDAAAQWPVWHIGLTATEYIPLNTTAIKTTGATTYWGGALPTSSVFSLGTSNDVNANNGNYVAYLFAPVPGFSVFGTFNAVNSSDGPFIYCGFRPRYVMWRVINNPGTSGWNILDAGRSGAGNPAALQLDAQSNAIEITGIPTDFLSNGFKLRHTTTAGFTFIYMAFAEVPFKYALAR